MLIKFYHSCDKILAKKQFKGEGCLFGVRVGGDEAAGHTVSAGRNKER